MSTMRKRNYLFLKTLILSICISSSGAGAIPVIEEVIRDSVSGKVTIRGSGFGQGPNIHLFDEFEDSSAENGGIIPLDSPAVGAWTKHGTYKPLYADRESVSGQFSALMFDMSANRMRQFQSIFEQGIQEVFLSYWVRVPEGTYFPGHTTPIPDQFSSSSSWKFAWLIDQDYLGNSSDVCIPTHTGYGKFSLSGNDGIIHQISGNSWWSWTSWNRFSIWLRANSDNPTMNGDVLFQSLSKDKGLYSELQSKPAFDTDGPETKQYLSLNIPGWIRDTEVVNVQPLYDDIYVATGPRSASRIELSNSMSYASSNGLALQLPDTWTDTEIVFSPRNGSLTDSNNAYIFIFNENGVSNIEGALIGSSFPKAPCLKNITVRTSQNSASKTFSCEQ